MAQYIDKDALVAEIERKYETNLIGAHSAFRNGKIEALREVKDFLNTLEVKEVDLEKSISDWLNEGLPNEEELLDYIKETAKHFYVLGLKAQKGK